MGMSDLQRFLNRIADAAGCMRQCRPSGGELYVSPIFRVIHNGVSFSRMTDIDMYLMYMAEEGVEEALTAWLKAHHAGDRSIPFEYRRSDGQVVIVPEAEGEPRIAG